MTYEVQPVPFKPNRLEGLSDRLLITHYENNYDGAARRLNALERGLEQADWAALAVFELNGLGGERLIATLGKPTNQWAADHRPTYAAIEAADATSGLKVLQSNVRIDLLITDVGLPGGINGRQMADAARANRPGLKVLFITGYAENTAVRNGHLEAGMDVLTKPFAMQGLASRIQTIITGSRGDLNP
jgi:CheY-like chemotaxis protein